MADYNSTFTETDGVDDVDAADFSTEFDAIEAAIATKYDSSTGTIQATSINDTNNNEEIKFTATGSAVNELTIANAAAGNKPAITQTGSGDVGLDIEGVEIHNGAIDATTLDGDTVTCNTTLNIPADSVTFTEIDSSVTNTTLTGAQNATNIVPIGVWNIGTGTGNADIEFLIDGSTWQAGNNTSSDAVQVVSDGVSVRVKHTTVGTTNVKTRKIFV